MDAKLCPAIGIDLGMSPFLVFLWLAVFLPCSRALALQAPAIIQMHRALLIPKLGL